MQLQGATMLILRWLITAQREVARISCRSSLPFFPPRPSLISLPS